MRARVWVLGLAVIMLAGVGAAGPRAVAAQAPADTKIEVVRAAYQILLDQFYRPLDPAELLEAGWSALTDALEAEGLPAPPALPALPSEREAAFAAFSRTYADYVAGLPEDVTATDAAFLVTSGMADSVQEGHTSFLPPDAFRGLLADLGGAELPVGLGIIRPARPPWLVLRVAPGGPADRAGIVAGDIIVGADRRDISKAGREQFSAALAGEAGTPVVVTVDRDGRRLDLTVTRGPYYFPPLESRLLPGGIGYVRLDSFGYSGTELPDGTELLSDFDARLDALDAAGARGLILDLRGNSGGSSLTELEILGRFLPEDELVGVSSDQRGHQIAELASGMMRRVQHPMVVLVDGDSASASEATAAALREADRALLVGTRTAGVLSTALFLPLPEEAGLSVAVADFHTSRTGFRVDEVGFPVDVEVEDKRTATDFLAGRDPQLDAAIVAIERAPAPPPVRTTPAVMTAAELRALLAPYTPAAADVPHNQRLTDVRRLSSRVLTHPNQLITANGSSRSPLALQRVIRNRGYLGSFTQEYGSAPGAVPVIGVSVDLYATADGAAEAVATNDYPDLQEAAAPAISLGDQTAQYRGIWINQGGLALTWRRDNVVFSVYYFDVPGGESPDTILALARLVDQRYTPALVPAGAR